MRGVNRDHGSRQLSKSGHLRGVLVSALGSAEFAELFDEGRRVAFDAGQTIFSAGDPGQSLILIEEGRVEVSDHIAFGRKSVLAHMGPGEVLGEIAALDGGPRSADCPWRPTRSPASAWRRDNVLAFVSNRPDTARAINRRALRKGPHASEMFSDTIGGRRRTATRPRAPQALREMGPTRGRRLRRC